VVISVINQKGGVGKTTTAVNLAVALAQWGHKILLVDLDPQGNASSGSGLRQVASPSLYDCVIALRAEDADPATAPRPQVHPGAVPNLDILGASPEFAGAEIELSDNNRRDDVKRVLTPLLDTYSLIIIDTPPSLSLITVNALVAADQLLIPVQCEYFALEGLGQLLRTLERITRSLNPSLRVMGLLRTMFDSRVGLSGQVSEELQTHFPTLLFDTIIPRTVRLAEAPSHGQPIALYDKRSTGADAYRRLSVEVLHRAGLESGA
jgi:chromosome partitioning protein